MFAEQVVYIQIEQDLFKFLHVQSGRTAQKQGVYSNQRLAIANFYVAEYAIKQALDEVCPRSFFRTRPVVVIHQMFKSEGGLCEIEERILREISFGAGCKNVFVWQGSPLSPKQLENKVYKNKL